MIWRQMMKSSRSNYRHFFAFAIAVVFLLLISYLVYCEFKLIYLNNILAVSQSGDDVLYIEQAIQNISQNKVIVPAYTVPLLSTLIAALIRLS